MSIFGPIEAACKITFLSYYLFTFLKMNDIVHSQDKSMEGSSAIPFEGKGS